MAPLCSSRHTGDSFSSVAVDLGSGLAEVLLELGSGFWGGGEVEVYDALLYLCGFRTLLSWPRVSSSGSYGQPFHGGSHWLRAPRFLQSRKPEQGVDRNPAWSLVTRNRHEALRQEQRPQPVCLTASAAGLGTGLKKGLRLERPGA